MSNGNWVGCIGGTGEEFVEFRKRFVVNVPPDKDNYSILDYVEYYLTGDRHWVKLYFYDGESEGIKDAIAFRHPVTAAHDFLKYRRPVPDEIAEDHRRIATDPELYEAWRSDPGPGGFGAWARGEAPTKPDASRALPGQGRLVAFDGRPALRNVRRKTLRVPLGGRRCLPGKVDRSSRPPCFIRGVYQRSVRIRGRGRYP